MADATEMPAGNRKLKIALALSLALNLGVAGMVGGVMLRDGPPRGAGGKDFGLGPLSEALSREDRKALRSAFVERHPDVRGSRREARAEFAALLLALRADPFDPAALDSALAAVALRNQALLDTGRDLVAERLKSMDAGERAAFANRLEKQISRGKKRDGKGGAKQDDPEKADPMTEGSETE